MVDSQPEETVEQLATALKDLYARDAEHMSKLEQSAEDLPFMFARSFKRELSRCSSPREIKLQMHSLGNLSNARAMAGKQAVIASLLAQLQSLADVQSQAMELERKIEPLLGDRNVISFIRDLKNSVQLGRGESRASAEVPSARDAESLNKASIETTDGKTVWSGKASAAPGNGQRRSNVDEPGSLGFVAKIRRNFDASVPTPHKVWRGLGAAAGGSIAVVEAVNAINAREDVPNTGKEARNWAKTVLHGAVAAGSAAAGVAALLVNKGRAR